MGGPLAGMAAGKLAGKVVDSNFARGGNSGSEGGFGGVPPQAGGYSFFNQAGINSYAQLGNSYQFPQSGPQSSMFGPQQSIWSFQGDPYKSQQPAQRYAGGGGGDLGLGGGGCVTVDTVLPGHERAGDVKVGDYLEVVDAKTLDHTIAKVSFSEAMPQPCVLIRTANGVELECSESAPICNAEGEQVLSVSLLGHKVPTVVDGKTLMDVVVEVRPIGEKVVQKITCENRFFLAGKTAGRYLLHHNVKSQGQPRTTSVAAGPQSYRYGTFDSGLKWGW